MKHKKSYIIFGASGDLSKRYLLPALQNFRELKIVLIGRKDYTNLKSLVPGEGEKIFHLAIPPEAVPEAVELISKNFGRENVKILLEKPFGKDLALAENLVKHIDRFFSEDQIYRIDHYLAKESLQKIVGKIDHDLKSVEIIASEKIDIEGRVNFYEGTGALQDFVQSHMLEMAAIVLSQSYHPEKRHEALRNMAIICDVSKHECVKRGQYAGYREEVGNPESMTETFVSINMISGGVHINLRTGKAMKEKLTQIKVKYKNGTENIFNIQHEKDAYERVIAAALVGNHELFISQGEVLESWRILDNIQQSWKNSKEDLIIYPKNTDIKELI